VPQRAPATYEGAPRDETEQQVADIWQNVLGVDQVKVTDDFFELGGHSMLLASLAVQIQKRFGCDLPLRAFFRAPTVQELADLLREPASQGETSLESQEPPPTGQHASPLDSPPPATKPATQTRHKPREKTLVAAFRRLWGGPVRRARIQDSFLGGLRNRLFQQIATSIPGAKTLRVWLHRARGVKIGKNVFIGYGVVLESAFPALIEIGDNVFISVRTVMIGHFMGSGLSARLNGGRSIKIGDNVSIGPNVTILPNVTIGDGAVIAAGSVVNASVPPLTLVQGSPAQVVAHCGIRLMGNPYEKFINNLTLVQPGTDT
jgi:acetyltransferase-like isoleucine patch superfamily enzyme/acyl carrier protein